MKSFRSFKLKAILILMFFSFAGMTFESCSSNGKMAQSKKCSKKSSKSKKVKGMAPGMAR